MAYDLYEDQPVAWAVIKLISSNLAVLVGGELSAALRTCQ